MRKIKALLRLHFHSQLSHRQIAQSLNIGYGTVVDYLQRFERAELTWPLDDALDERDLGRLLFPSQPASGQRRFAEPDFAQIRWVKANKGTKSVIESAFLW